jgi:hypothetical protein
MYALFLLYSCFTTVWPLSINSLILLFLLLLLMYSCPYASLLYAYFWIYIYIYIHMYKYMYIYMYIRMYVYKLYFWFTPALPLSVNDAIPLYWNVKTYIPALLQLYSYFSCCVCVLVYVCVYIYIYMSFLLYSCFTCNIHNMYKICRYWCL